MIKLKVATIQLLCSISRAGGTPYLVGGCVRDYVMGITPKDIDVEVYGMSYNTLLAVVAEYKPKVVGESFGVIKVDLRPWGGDELDLSLPRRDSKNGVGHKGFNIEFSSDMTLEEASARRDFTMNSMAMNPFTGEIIDPWGGLQDIKKNIIRHTSDSFSDDPLRVLRLMQFVGRFGFDVDYQTLWQCCRLRCEFNTLPRERIKEEFDKLFLKGRYIKLGLEVLNATGWLSCFPELFAMWGLPQDHTWHPEGCVWTHTL